MGARTRYAAVNARAYTKASGPVTTPKIIGFTSWPSPSRVYPPSVLSETITTVTAYACTDEYSSQGEFFRLNHKQFVSAIGELRPSGAPYEQTKAFRCLAESGSIHLVELVSRQPSSGMHELSRSPPKPVSEVILRV